jgi:hypothetical protein
MTDTDLPVVMPSDATFERWLARAAAGDSFVYHRGSLALATNERGEVLQYPARQRLARVAHCAWVAGVQGHVHLLQRREGPTALLILRWSLAEDSQRR